jgi:hypothetical protein
MWPNFWYSGNGDSWDEGVRDNRMMARCIWCGKSSLKAYRVDPQDLKNMNQTHYLLHILHKSSTTWWATYCIRKE